MKEPFLEPILRQIRFNKVLKHISPKSIVVDIGCGHTPHLLNRLERYIKSGIGIDQLIGNTNNEKIKLISYSLQKKIPLKNNYADHVTLIAVLEHLEEPESIIKETHRILKKSGTLILTTPSPANKPLLEFLAFKIGIVSTREIAEHKRYYWKNNLTKIIKEAGFKKVNHHYFELWLNNFIVAYK